MENKIIASKSNFIKTLRSITKHNENIEIVVDYPDWKIIRIGHQFFCCSFEMNDNNKGNITFSEVYPIAHLEYSICDDIKLETMLLHQLVENDVCGEQVTDENIHYWWFKAVK